MSTRALREANVDLHCHSVVSDGTLSPADVVRRAAANGVEVLALTDHDTLSGLAQAQAAARECGIGFVAGVEISVSWASETVHIVGLRIDATDRRLVDGLAATRSGRDERAEEIGRQLAAAGIADAYRGALRHAVNPALISRAHFARHIVETGRFATVSEVFEHFLSPGLPGYVPHRWAALGDAVGWIRGAGGVAVIAHPGRYRLDALGLDTLVGEFQAAGGTGIEVVSGAHTVDEYARFAALARRYGLLASRGSDFHGPAESRTDLGALPALPGSVEPIWTEWLQ